MNSISNLKKYVFPFIMMFTLIIFGAQGLMNVTNAASDRVVSISKDTDVSTISLKDKSILKLGKDINSSFDLSKLPAVTEKTSIVVEIENGTAAINFTGKLPENYDVPLVILDGNSVAGFSEKSYKPSVYYPNKGTEKNPDVLELKASTFDLSLLPDKDSKTYLCIMDMCETTGIDFGDSILPKNYDVSKIFILHEEDKQTFKDAFQNAEISVMSNEDMNKKFVELFTVKDTSMSDNKTTSDSSEKKSTSTSSSKKTGDDMTSIYFLSGSFVLFSAIFFLFRKKLY